jgi:hypothetical protein
MFSSSNGRWGAGGSFLLRWNPLECAFPRHPMIETSSFRNVVLEKTERRQAVSIKIIIMSIVGDPVAARFVACALRACTVDRGFQSRLRHGCLFLVSLCCVFLCR